MQVGIGRMSLDGSLQMYYRLLIFALGQELFTDIGLLIPQPQRIADAKIARMIKQTDTLYHRNITPHGISQRNFSVFLFSPRLPRSHPPDIWERSLQGCRLR